MSVPRTFSVVYLERHTNWNRSEKKDVHPVLIATGLFVYRLLHEKIATTEPNTREKKEEEELNTTISSECHLPNYTSVQWWIVETKISKYLLLFWYLTVPHFVFTYLLYEPRRFHVLIEIFCCVCVFFSRLVFVAWKIGIFYFGNGYQSSFVERTHYYRLTALQFNLSVMALRNSSLFAIMEMNLNLQRRPNRFRLLQFHPNLSQLAWHVFIAFERTAVKWLDIRACWLDEGFLRKELTFFGLAIFVRRICAYRVKLPSIREKCGCFLTKGSNIQCS